MAKQNNDIFSVPEYYRRAKVDPVAGQPIQQTPQGPQPDGELWGMANAATLGPMRALYGGVSALVTIPAMVTPAGVQNQAVRLAANDQQTPLYVRVRLTNVPAIPEGRVGFSTSVGGRAEHVNLVVETGYRFEQILLNGERLLALGTWPGVAPVSIQVTVFSWRP
jgi:hypothetical protein